MDTKQGRGRGGGMNWGIGNDINIYTIDTKYKTDG